MPGFLLLCQETCYYYGDIATTAKGDIATMPVIQLQWGFLKVLYKGKQSDLILAYFLQLVPRPYFRIELLQRSGIYCYVQFTVDCIINKSNIINVLKFNTN